MSIYKEYASFGKIITFHAQRDKLYQICPNFPIKILQI